MGMAYTSIPRPPAALLICALAWPAVATAEGGFAQTGKPMWADSNKPSTSQNYNSYSTTGASGYRYYLREPYLSPSAQAAWKNATVRALQDAYKRERLYNLDRIQRNAQNEKAHLLTRLVRSFAQRRQTLSHSFSGLRARLRSMFSGLARVSQGLRLRALRTPGAEPALGNDAAFGNTIARSTSDIRENWVFARGRLPRPLAQRGALGFGRGGLGQRGTFSRPRFGQRRQLGFPQRPQRQRNPGRTSR